MKKQSIQDAIKLIEDKKLNHIIICSSGHIFLPEAKNMAEDYCRRNGLTMKFYSLSELKEILKNTEEENPVSEKNNKKK